MSGEADSKLAEGAAGAGSRGVVIVLLLAALVFFTGLGSAGLWDEDEPLYASVAFEMRERGDWVVPIFNGVLFAEKPPLAYWLMVAAYELFGVTELAARFWSALLGVGTAVLTCRLGSRLFGERAGLWSGIVMATTLLFTVSARAATTDSLLVFLTTAAMLAFVAGGNASSAATDEHAPAGRHGAWGHVVLLYACLGLAVLTKGPVGFVLPFAVLLAFVVLKELPAVGGRGIAHAVRQLRPLAGIALAGVIATPWFVLVDARTGGAFTAEFFGTQNLQRITSALQGHSGPFWYYVPAILVGFFPWSIFIAPVVIELARGVARPGPFRGANLFVACWIAVFVVAWSVPATKLPHYVLPAFPALALATGSFIDRWISRREVTHRGWMTAAAGICAAVGIAGVALFPLVAERYVPGEEQLRFLWLPLIVEGVIFRTLVRRGRPERAMQSLAVVSALLLLGVFAFAAARIDRYQEARPIVERLRATAPGECQLAGYRFGLESLVFYSRQRVETIYSVPELRGFLRRSERPFVFTSNEHEAELRTKLGNELEVVARRRRFLRDGELVLFGPRSSP